MKKLLLWGIVGLFSSMALAQSTYQTRSAPLPLAVYGDNLNAPLTQKERGLILEVYGEYAKEFVFDRPQMLKEIKNLLRNRIVIEKNSQILKKNDVIQLSAVSVFNAYVPSLKRDKYFDINQFNPLKYNFDFFSKEAKVYRVDGTEYTILIKSQYQKI